MVNCLRSECCILAGHMRDFHHSDVGTQAAQRGTGAYKRAVCLFLAFAAMVAGQSVPEPDMADIFYRLDGDKLVSLERQGSATQTGAHGFIVMSMKSAAEFPGAKSPIRFKAGQPLTFIVRSAVPIGTIDPNTIFHFRKLVEKKKVREMVMMSGSANPFGASIKTSGTTGLLPVEFSKYGDHSMRAVTESLSPGEYAFSKMGGVAFCFGID
jgi:hypothetical protein